jgi:hypothetical protein
MGGHMRRARITGVGLALALMAPASAGAGTLSHAGYTAGSPEATGSVYMGIGTWGYEPYFRSIGVFQNSTQPVQLADYTAASSYETIGPGSCGSSEPGKIDCGLAPRGGEPFHITGSEGSDNFVEIGCNAGRQADYTPCERVFKIALGSGDDYMRLWNFSDSLGDERDDSGMHPWVAAARAPMHGVEIDGGPGRDEIILMGGPSTGRIDAGAGDDRIFTRGGYSVSEEPVDGGYAIVCGPGRDVVQPGPGDTIAKDCEQIAHSDAELYPEDGEPQPPEPSRGSDIASTCGVARFDFRTPAGERMGVRKGKRGCVYLVSNRLARQLLSMAYNSDGNVSQAFVEVLAIAARAAKEVDPNSEALEGFITDQIPLPDGQDIIQRALPGWIRDGIDTAGRANPLTLIGQATGSLAIPLRTLHRIDQIEAKDACLQFAVTVRKGKAKVDSRVIYNPRHFDDPTGAYARVHKRQDGLLTDSYPKRYLSLSCKDTGMVATKPRRATGKVFEKGYRTTVGEAT